MLQASVSLFIISILQIDKSVITNLRRELTLKSHLTSHQITPQYIYHYVYDADQGLSLLASTEFISDTLDKQVDITENCVKVSKSLEFNDIFNTIKAEDSQGNVKSEIEKSEIQLHKVENEFTSHNDLSDTNEHADTTDNASDLYVIIVNEEDNGNKGIGTVNDKNNVESVKIAKIAKTKTNVSNFFVYIIL